MLLAEQPGPPSRFKATVRASDPPNSNNNNNNKCWHMYVDITSLQHAPTQGVVSMQFTGSHDTHSAPSCTLPTQRVRTARSLTGHALCLQPQIHGRNGIWKVRGPRSAGSLP